MHGSVMNEVMDVYKSVYSRYTFYAYSSNSRSVRLLIPGSTTITAFSRTRTTPFPSTHTRMPTARLSHTTRTPRRRSRIIQAATSWTDTARTRQVRTGLSGVVWDIRVYMKITAAVGRV